MALQSPFFLLVCLIMLFVCYIGNNNSQSKYLKWISDSQPNNLNMLVDTDKIDDLNIPVAYATLETNFDENNHLVKMLDEKERTSTMLKNNSNYYFYWDLNNRLIEQERITTLVYEILDSEGNSNKIATYMIDSNVFIMSPNNLSIYINDADINYIKFINVDQRLDNSIFLVTGMSKNVQFIINRFELFKVEVLQIKKEQSESTSISEYQEIETEQLTDSSFLQLASKSVSFKELVKFQFKEITPENFTVKYVLDENLLEGILHYNVLLVNELEDNSERVVLCTGLEEHKKNYWTYVKNSNTITCKVDQLTIEGAIKKINEHRIYIETVSHSNDQNLTKIKLFPAKQLIMIDPFELSTYDTIYKDNVTDNMLENRTASTHNEFNDYFLPESSNVNTNVFNLNEDMPQSDVELGQNNDQVISKVEDSVQFLVDIDNDTNKKSINEAFETESVTDMDKNNLPDSDLIDDSRSDLNSRNTDESISESSPTVDQNNDDQKNKAVIETDTTKLADQNNQVDLGSRNQEDMDMDDEDYSDSLDKEKEMDRQLDSENKNETQVGNNSNPDHSDSRNEDKIEDDSQIDLDTENKVDQENDLTNLGSGLEEDRVVNNQVDQSIDTGSDIDGQVDSDSVDENRENDSQTDVDEKSGDYAEDNKDDSGNDQAMEPSGSKEGSTKQVKNKNGKNVTGFGRKKNFFIDNMKLMIPIIFVFVVLVVVLSASVSARIRRSTVFKYSSLPASPV